MFVRLDQGTGDSWCRYMTPGSLLTDGGDGDDCRKQVEGVPDSTPASGERSRDVHAEHPSNQRAKVGFTFKCMYFNDLYEYEYSGPELRVSVSGTRCPETDTRIAMDLGRGASVLCLDVAFVSVFVSISDQSRSDHSLLSTVIGSTLSTLKAEIHAAASPVTAKSRTTARKLLPSVPATPKSKCCRNRVKANAAIVPAAVPIVGDHDTKSLGRGSIHRLRWSGPLGVTYGAMLPWVPAW